jgi:serine/threonine protein kinase
MGEVYRARDSRLDREVAIKVLPANLSSDASVKQRLEREAKAISKLSHPHICTLHDIGHQDGVDYLVMEYLEGETLEQRLIKGPLQPEQAVRYAAQIADALAKAHKLGITHRDLKPANVMLTKGGAKLMDFGLAKLSGSAPLTEALTEMTQEQARLTSEGMIIGTFQYMAPEQLEGKEADARTDIFALGELIHEMITGKPTFSGKSRASLIAAILTTDPPPITQSQTITPVALEQVVRKCLAKDPEERWQSASDLASQLNWILSAGSSQRARAPNQRTKTARARPLGGRGGDPAAAGGLCGMAHRVAARERQRAACHGDTPAGENAGVQVDRASGHFSRWLNSGLHGHRRKYESATLSAQAGFFRDSAHSRDRGGQDAIFFAERRMAGIHHE